MRFLGILMVLAFVAIPSLAAGQDLGWSCDESVVAGTDFHAKFTSGPTPYIYVSILIGGGNYQWTIIDTYPGSILFAVPTWAVGLLFECVVIDSNGNELDRFSQVIPW